MHNTSIIHICIFINFLCHANTHTLDKEYNELVSSNESVFMTKTLKINGNLKTNQLYTDNLTSDKIITVSDNINSVNIEANTVITDILIVDEIFSDKDELQLNGNIILINNVLSESLKVNQNSDDSTNNDKISTSTQNNIKNEKTSQSNRDYNDLRDLNWILNNQHSSFIETKNIINTNKLDKNYRFEINKTHKQIKMMLKVEVNDNNDELFMFANNKLVWQSDRNFILDNKIYNINSSFEHNNNELNLKFTNTTGFNRKLQKVSNIISKNQSVNLNISQNDDYSNTNFDSNLDPVLDLDDYIDVTIKELFIYYS